MEVKYMKQINMAIINVIATATNTVTTTINGCVSPRALCASPDGSKVYAADYNGGIRIINTAADTIMATVNAGLNPIGINISPDGSKVYVTNQKRR